MKPKVAVLPTLVLLTKLQLTGPQMGSRPRHPTRWCMSLGILCLVQLVKTLYSTGSDIVDAIFDFSFFFSPWVSTEYFSKRIVRFVQPYLHSNAVSCVVGPTTRVLCVSSSVSGLFWRIAAAPGIEGKKKKRVCRIVHPSPLLLSVHNMAHIIYRG